MKTIPKDSPDFSELENVNFRNFRLLLILFRFTKVFFKYFLCKGPLERKGRGRGWEEEEAS
jgi:hypothetical protein